jgi:hypothetical protein
MAPKGIEPPQADSRPGRSPHDLQDKPADARDARQGARPEVAERIGVSQQTIARREGGAEIPSRYLKDIAILLDCRVELIRAEAQGPMS